MKKFSTAFIICLIVVFVGTVSAVHFLPDFTEPSAQIVSDIELDPVIWEKNADDLAAYLVEKGVLNSVDDYAPLIDGMSTDSRSYNMGFELYWWDVDALEEDSDEAKNYRSASEEGNITIFGMGISVIVHGPFAIGTFDEYTGNVEELINALESYCAK